MKISITLAGREIALKLLEKPAPPPDTSKLEKRISKLEEAREMPDKWDQWKANSSANGGQFGFGPRHYPIERDHERWGG